MLRKEIGTEVQPPHKKGQGAMKDTLISEKTPERKSETREGVNWALRTERARLDRREEIK